MKSVPSNSDDKLIRFKESDFPKMEPASQMSRQRRNKLFEGEFKLLTKFNSHQQVFLHLNSNALLVYKNKDHFKG